MKMGARYLASSVIAISLQLICCFVAIAADVDTYLTRGVSAFAKKDYERAYEIYSEGLKQELDVADKSRLLQFRALAADSARKTDQAEADYTAAVKLTGNSDPKVYSSRGFFYYNHERFDLSLADYTAGARLFPSDGVFPNGQGLALSALGKFDEAIGYFNEAIRLDPTSGVFKLGRAEAYNRSDRPQQALEDYARVPNLQRLVKKDVGRFHVGRGYAYLKLKKYDAAIVEFNAAVELIPSLVNAWKWRALSYERLGNVASACRDYEATLKLDPSDDVVSARLKSLCKV
jgi:tetratricopeptide (TPR) repeat protein